jgi:hypothetical protein
VLAGAGALAALRGGGEGRVVAWFPKACYVSLPGGLVALVAQGVAPGPIHAVLDGALRRAAHGARARIVEHDLEIGGLSIDLADAARWCGALPPPDEVRASADRIVAAAAEGAARSSLLVDAFRARGERARQALITGAVEDAARLLVGVGPGLTPSGDDALAGALFALRAAAGTDAEPLTRAAAEAGTTGPISRGFLRWAARGQALEPAHDLLASAARADSDGASRAARRMAAVGETSGADTLLGLRWGVEAASQRSAVTGRSRR